MSVYKFIDLENGDKILKKINNIKITDLKLIKDYDFKKSVITECLVNNEELDK
jgi:hypothetical protein